MSKPTIEELDAILNNKDVPDVVVNEDGSCRPTERIDNFRSELEELVNCHSLENNSDTPDWILAKFITDCLAAFDAAVLGRDKWYGFKGLSRR